MTYMCGLALMKVLSMLCVPRVGAPRRELHSTCDPVAPFFLLFVDWGGKCDKVLV